MFKILKAGIRRFPVENAVVLFLLFMTNPALGQDVIDLTREGVNDQNHLQFDFPGMKVGIAEYEEGPTGTTVFYFPGGVKGAVDIRGGSPGTVNASALMNSYEYKMIEAVVFSGGSWYGLSAATGVANGIKQIMTQKGDVDHIAGVVAAIIYDVGGRRYSRITPDDHLGIKAVNSAKPNWFPMGARGAGRFTMQGVYYLRGESVDKYANWPHSGQGGAFRTVGPTRIGVFTVVNSLGTIVDRSGRIVRCNRNRADEECPLISEKLGSFKPIGGGEEKKATGQTSNTTLTLVVTNQKLPYWALERLAVQVHGSMSRAIQPFSTEDDGDVLYAVTTDEVENTSLSVMDLGVLASELAWDAVLNSVPELPDAPALLKSKPEEEALHQYSGTYQLYGGNELTIDVSDASLTAVFKGNGRIYFDEGKVYRLAAAENDMFVIDSPARDVIRFEYADDQVSGLTLNPGPWPIHAKLKVPGTHR